MKCNKKWCQFRFHCAVCNIDSDSFTQSCKGNRQYEMMSISASISPRCQLWYLHQQAPNNAYNYLPNSLVTAVGYNEIGNTMMLLSSPILLRRHMSEVTSGITGTQYMRLELCSQFHCQWHWEKGSRPTPGIISSTVVLLSHQSWSLEQQAHNNAFSLGELCRCQLIFIFFY